MSGYKKHLMVGMVVTCIASLIIFYKGYLPLSFINVAYLLAIAFVFSLLPDIDIGTSLIRKVILTAFILYLLIYGVGTIGYILGAAMIIVLFLPHRGIMHTLLMGAMLSGLLWFYFHNIIFPIVAVLNFMSHRVMDGIII